MKERSSIENYHVGNPIFRLFFSKDFSEGKPSPGWKTVIFDFSTNVMMIWKFQIPGTTQGMGHIFILSLFTSIVLGFEEDKKMS